MIAARLSPGAISESSTSHLPPIEADIYDTGLWSEIKFGGVTVTPANSSDTFALVQPSRPPSKQNTWDYRRQKHRDDRTPVGRT